jgi:hypothetical protein
MRRPLFLASAAMAALASALVLALALDADGASLLFGAAAVAISFTVVVGAWLRPLEHRRRRQHRHEERKARQRAIRTRAAVHSAERRLYSQLEALSWLRDELKLATPLPPTRGAAAAPDALLELLRIIDRSHATSVLELGSGVSTIVCARRLQQAGSGHVVALEHLPEYAVATRTQITAQGLDAFATVLDAPLRDVRIGDDTWNWYELGPGVPEAVDLLFIDGPPKLTGTLARYPALPLLRDRLLPGANVLVDDGDRTDEHEMVRRWEAEIEGIGVQHLPFAKGAWLLTMPE